MTRRGPFARALTALGLSCGVILALASGLVLHGSGAVVVGIAAGFTAWVAFIARHENRAAAFAAAGQAAAWAAGSIMVVTGAEVVGGGAMVALVIGLAGVVAGAVWLPRVMQARSSQRHGPGPAAPGNGASAGASMRLAGLLDGSSPPVSLLPTIVLGREWLQTSAALDSRLEPAARQIFVRRRQDVLDELERRDPAGFARWLVAGPDGDNDPADFVQGRQIKGGDTA